MANIKHDLVSGKVEDVQERERQFNQAKVRRQMPPAGCDLINDALPQRRRHLSHGVKRQ